MTDLGAIIQDIKEVITGDYKLPVMIMVRSKYLRKFIGLYFPFGLITAFSYSDKPLLAYGLLHEINHDKKKKRDGLVRNYFNILFNRLGVENEVTKNTDQDFNKLRLTKGYDVKPVQEAWVSNFYEDSNLSVNLMISNGNTEMKKSQNERKKTNF